MKEVKKLFIVLLILIVLAVSLSSIQKKQEIRTIKSEKELLQIVKEERGNRLSFFEKMITLPFSIFANDRRIYAYNSKGGRMVDYVEDAEGTTTSVEPKEYSETNIQVEGVDEADIIKTDGNYIYSISENKVIITNVKDPENPKIEATIYNDNAIPSDLLLYKDRLVVISAETDLEREYRFYYYNRSNTVVDIYDIKEKDTPKRLKSFELQEPYFTTRCIDGKLYVFSKGYLREENDKINRDYIEDNKTKQIELKKIHYLKDQVNSIQTLIAELDLNNIQEVELSSYLMDLSNAYISKENIYLLNTHYNHRRIPLKSIFGWKGIFGIIEEIDNNDYSYGNQTRIYKFALDKKKGVTYQTNTTINGHTINQYSLDEKDGNLRIALESWEGTRVAVLDKNLKLLGETESLEKNEDMYASRFIGDKAYLVTYRNTDPLFVIDLSNPKKPEVLGELKIPGYSTYLHPYDENHLIGIGMDTEEVINRDSYGNVTSSWVTITGMKMSLFDVSDIHNPREIDKTTIGDSRTVSAILTNPKALLFSKEKELLAIPVNHYQEDFLIEESEMIEEDIELFKEKDDYVSEGYFVYHIDLEGFQLKGVINHEKKEDDWYQYYPSKLLRGLYIEENLYTVSETELKVNQLSDLKEISQLKFKEGDH